MLFTVLELRQKWGISPSGVVHIGAHEAEELESYRENDWLPVVWIEAQTNLALELSKKLDTNQHQVIEATLWDTNNTEFEFNVTNNGQSSSLLKLGTHSTSYPEITVIKKEIKKTIRYDQLNLKFNDGNFLNIDVQGAELNVLKGMGSKIDKFKWIYSEVNKIEVYENCVLVDELDKFLAEHGFSRVATRWCFGKGWGDALYKTIRFLR